MLNMMAELLGNSKKTIYRWKDENRPIISLLEKYFTKENVKEFLGTHQIEKLELIKNYTLEELKLKLNSKSTDSVKEIEDYLIVNIRYKIENHIKKSILKNILKKVLSENNLIDTANDINAKAQLIKAIQNYKISITKLEFKDWKTDTIQFITDYLISDEVFLIIKYPDKFLEDK